jgi:hypothetical protein
VEHAVEGLALLFGVDEKLFKSPPVRKLAFHKFHALRNQFPPAVAQVIENNWFVPALGKKAGNSPTYVPRPSCDQYVHKSTVLSMHFGLP